MGYPRYQNVKEINAATQPFENYLRQIHYLYPNLPDTYVKYMNLIHQFYFSEYNRMKGKKLSETYYKDIFNIAMNDLPSIRLTNPTLYVEYLNIVGTVFLSSISDMKYSNVDEYISYIQTINQFTFDELHFLRELDYEAYTSLLTSMTQTVLNDISLLKDIDSSSYQTLMLNFVSFLDTELNSIKDNENVTINILMNLIMVVMNDMPLMMNNLGAMSGAFYNIINPLLNHLNGFYFMDTNKIFVNDVIDQLFNTLMNNLQNYINSGQSNQYFQSYLPTASTFNRTLLNEVMNDTVKFKEQFENIFYVSITRFLNPFLGLPQETVLTALKSILYITGINAINYSEIVGRNIYHTFINTVIRNTQENPFYLDDSVSPHTAVEQIINSYFNAIQEMNDTEATTSINMFISILNNRLDEWSARFPSLYQDLKNVVNQY